MKKALVNYVSSLRRAKLDANPLIFYHDEFQTEVHPDHAHKSGELAVQSIRDAGEYFKCPCPLDAEYKLGLNWGDTH